MDLIVFAVEQNAEGKRRFKETTKGIGKSCGSTFVDRKMRKLLRSKLKRVVNNIPQQALEAMMESFVDIMKPSFDGQDSLFLHVPMSLGLTQHTDPSIGLDDGVLRFSAEELKERVFEPVIKNVLELLHEQRAQTHNLKAIFTVGGFGASQYLHQRISEEFGRFGIKVIAPYRPGKHPVFDVYFASPLLAHSYIMFRTRCGQRSSAIRQKSYHGCYPCTEILVWYRHHQYIC